MIDYETLKNVLSKKYGSGKEVSAEAHIWTQGNRTIDLACYDTYLRLNYHDQAIADRRIDELKAQAEAQAESADL